uniref:Uncharacterized protein n=1 Tax=Dermonema virens TaxID=1077399 RepID=A0A1G4NRM3_9FLOR|nr:Hypothetical protein ORF_2 [Dermonema virens]SCW21312.1 Hypothetical protein ORF_2 [Dermonema virens]
MPFISSLHMLNNSFNYGPVKITDVIHVLPTKNLRNKTDIIVVSNKRKNYNTSSKLIIATESLYRFSKSQHHNQALFQELLNKYWKQTVFLSDSSPIAKKYESLLSKQDGMSVKNSKKKFMSGFSKALQRGAVYAELDTVTDQDFSLSKGPILYTWNKFLNLSLPRYWDGMWSNKRSPNFPNYLQSVLLQKLSHNNFPVFVVANGLNQMVVAEPANQLVYKNDAFYKLYQWYYDRFLWTNNDSSVYEGWFFVNPKDAEEYSNFIRDRYPRSANQHGLHVLSSGLHSYYKLNRLAPPRTEFRLFPDLEEVGKLVKSAKHRQGLIFDKKQNYGKNHFQGQPIYFIEPVNTTYSQNKAKTFLNYYYQIPGDASKEKYTAVFFNKTVALKAWNYFRSTNIDFKLPIKPKLRVYNLEDFLQDSEHNKDLINKKILFIPSDVSYDSIKSVESKKTGNYHALYKHMLYYKLTFSLWTQRLICSLVSKQPPN